MIFRHIVPEMWTSNPSTTSGRVVIWYSDVRLVSILDSPVVVASSPFDNSVPRTKIRPVGDRIEHHLLNVARYLQNDTVVCQMSNSVNGVVFDHVD